jgi:uncharacterized membrane protein
MAQDNTPNKEFEKETTRLETFSDGVFAIAITLLVLELIQFLHSQTDEGLLKTLRRSLGILPGFCHGFFNHTGLLDKSSSYFLPI